MMEFNEAFNQYLNRVKRMKDQFNDYTEEATKNALIMPFFSMLGYDVFNTEEFMPEYTCDVGTKKGEKVDYALLKDGEPAVLIEVKRAGMKLQKQQHGQLYRYFTVNRCRIAILTNGILYQIYSDLNTPNIMDDDPFVSFNLLEDDPAIYMSTVKQFTKERFDVKNILSKAVFQKYEKVVIMTLRKDFLSPSDEIVKYFLSRPEIKTGNRITAQMIEKHREITQRAMQKVMGTVINQTITPPNKMTTEAPTTVLVPEVSPAPTPPTEPSPTQPARAPIEVLKDALSTFTTQDEDTPAFIRIHIYSKSDNRKLGIVKITKPDMKMTFKVPGDPTLNELKDPEEIKKYL